MSAIRTVLGDISGDELGVCNAHDHLFLQSPQLPGQELDDLEAAEAELRAFAGAGGAAVVQWTPHGMGRRAGALAELARRTGTHLVAATGWHRAEHYRSGQDGALGDLAGLFAEELTRGVRGSVCGEGPRAGLIKVAGGHHGLDEHARRTLHAAAEAHHATDAPVAVQVAGGTGAAEVLALLCDERAVPPHRVLLGHCARLPDPEGPREGLREAAARGAWLVVDGSARAHHATDCLASLAELGYADRILLGGGTTTAGHAAPPGLRPEVPPGMSRLLRSLRPRLARESARSSRSRSSSVTPHAPSRPTGESDECSSSRTSATRTSDRTAVTEVPARWSVRSGCCARSTNSRAYWTP